MAMREDESAFLLGAPATRLELALTRPDGEPWSLTVSPGIERYIGFYPRIEGFACAGPVLVYRSLAVPG
ncbi:MAG TPA: hypothetical protein VIT45_18315 [Allosphingosinicella sp.]